MAPPDATNGNRKNCRNNSANQSCAWADSGRLLTITVTEINDMAKSKVESRYVCCPSCGARMSISKLFFREDFQCSRCQIPLHVSVTYSRVLVLLSGLISFVLLWALGIRNFWLFLLFLPLGFPILTVVVRIAPFVMRPHLLYVGKPSVFTKLDL